MNNKSGHQTVRNLTIITDLILISLAFAFAYIVRYDFQWLLPTAIRVPYSDYLGQQLLLTILLTVAFIQNRAWSRRRGEFWIDEVSRVGYATAAGIALMMAITFFFRPLAFSRLLLVWALLFIILFIAIARLARRISLNFLYRRGRGVDKALIIGSGEVARSVIRTLLARSDLGFQAVGYLGDGSPENNIGSGDEVVRICQQHGAQARVVPDLFQLSLNRVEFNNMAGIPMLSAREVRISNIGQVAKRVLDFGIVLIIAVPAILITLVTIIAIKLETSGPAFFLQERVGYKSKPFKMAKFRSMIVDAENKKEALRQLNEASGPIFKIKNDPRLTKVGRIIRRLSLDELPQLYNVFVGEMSLVGPRPPLPEEVKKYQPWHLQRLAVRGGMTGLWQVSGRADLTFDEQCLLDIYYIENWSLALDLRILLQTIPLIVQGRGAY
jgi:lipopolysaccharide/colanic/teichoic acid biosynthesis glycosyltransferase